jgi:anthranilate synthase component I
MISFKEVLALSRKGNIVPITARISSDLETPVSAFMKLATGKPYSFLLESIEGGEKLARYSFIGYDPFLIVKGTGDDITVQNDRETRAVCGNPAEFLEAIFAEYHPVELEGLPRFTGGAVGYFAYDCARWFEHLPARHTDQIGLPEMLFGLYKNIVAFDHLKQEMIVISNLLCDGPQKDMKKRYDRAVHQVNEIVTCLGQPLRRQRKSPPAAKATLRAPRDQKQYEAAVRKAKRYIHEGDIFQVVLSRRWEVNSNRPALEVYRRLRRINPSPYMFLLNFGDDSVVGSSPEMMVRIEGRQIETRPIAGTRPRGKNAAQDEKQVKSLLADPKELAEHTMLVDLGRNDIGRVSKPGTVAPREMMTIEKYSHVIHIVSSVVGQLASGVSPITAHFSCFPAGTVSGAPKIRAMEIIDELEPCHRGVYAGSIAYIDFWGNLDSCIAIRTLVKKGKTFYLQAGAGIVADSVPSREYRETEAKAGILMQAITGE